MNKLFVINGYPRSGKTFFGEVFAEEARNVGINFKHLSSVDLVKMIIKDQNSWDSVLIPIENWDEMLAIRKKITDKVWDGKTKDEYWRKVMFDTKTALGKEKPGFIEERLFAVASQVELPKIIFVDIREQYNVDFLREFCHKKHPEVSFGTIFVKSDCAEPANNGADRKIDSSLYDYIIENNRKEVTSKKASENLHKTTRKFIQQLSRE